MLVITNIRQFSTERICFVNWMLGTGFEKVKAEIVDGLNEFAKQHGCAAVESACRLGFERSLRNLGYRRSQIIIRRDVT